MADGWALGNGCVNDFSRTLSALVWEPLIPPTSVTVFSGGTEGVLSPHVLFLVAEPDATKTSLVAAVGRTRALEPHEVGTAQHARTVAEAVAGLIRECGEDRHLVRLVLVKCPLLTSSKVAAVRAAGGELVTADTYESMAKSRYASALGVAAALGEVDENHLEAVLQASSADEQVWCTRASCSSGAELEDCHILLLSSRSQAETGRLRAVSGFMTDAIDAEAFLNLLDQMRQQKGAVVQVFAKAEADPAGTIRGMRHTMSTDSDIHSTRHARAAVGGLLAGLTGDTQLYVSGGAEGQGPPGGGSLCVIYRC